MPEQLLGRIIRACSREGELVLDPFRRERNHAGRGQKLGRHFSGYELVAANTPRGCGHGWRAFSRAIRWTRPEPLVSVPNTANGRRLDEVPEPGTRKRRRLSKPSQSTLPGL